MEWICSQGCEIERAKSKGHPGTCKHGETLRYAKELKRTKPIRRVSEKRAPEARKRGSVLRQGRGFAVTEAQREKVRGLPCVNCGREASEYLAIDPAHLWPKGKGGCDHPDCVVPLCRMGDGSGCHRAFDNGELDLLSKLANSEAWAREMAHPIYRHGVNPITLVRRLSGAEHEFVKASEGAAREAVSARG